MPFDQVKAETRAFRKFVVVWGNQLFAMISYILEAFQQSVPVYFCLAPIPSTRLILQLWSEVSR